MIKKVCDIYQFGESYIFHPKNNSSLENLCLVPCENHIGSNFESSNIFDWDLDNIKNSLVICLSLELVPNCFKKLVISLFSILYESSE